jgi:hypothetical protein
MAYRQDLSNSARRHLEAATKLDEPGSPRRRDIAGYLYGLAAECALKELMRQSGMQPLPDRRKDPFYLHFPELKTFLRDQASGRYHGRLYKHATNSALMREWDIAMRYAPSADVFSKPIDEWAEQAKNLVQEMGAI